MYNFKLQKFEIEIFDSGNYVGLDWLKFVGSKSHPLLNEIIFNEDSV